MSTEALGRAIPEATKFLRTIHDDLRAQIRSLDRLMSDRGWRPAEPNKIGYDLGNSPNDGRLWVAERLQRAYVRSDADKTPDRVVAFVWYLYHDAGDAYEVPTLAAVAAGLNPSQAPGLLLPPDWYIGDVYGAAGRSAEPVPLTADQVRPFLPAAGPAAALVVPLCEMTSEDVLQVRLVGPILAAESRLSE